MVVLKAQIIQILSCILFFCELQNILNADKISAK